MFLTLLVFANWKSGIDNENSHHYRWLCGERCKYNKFEGWYGYEKETKLQGLPVEPHRSRLCAMIETYMSSPPKLMLDHGAGPFTNLGTTFTCPPRFTSLKHFKSQVVAVDPLASNYHRILNTFNVYNTTRTSYCPSEKLEKCIGNNNVDLSIIINALDHSENPILAFGQAINVTKSGGLVCIHSMRNEAHRQGGVGFHKWNFDIVDDKWIITNVNEASSQTVENIFINIKKVDTIYGKYDEDFKYLHVFSESDEQFLRCYRRT